MDLPTQGSQAPKEYPDGEGSLKGLCKDLAKDEQVLTHALEKGRILRWSSPKMVGVINFKTLAANYRVVEKTLSVWLPQTDVPKTILIEDAREQVGLEKKCKGGVPFNFSTIQFVIFNTNDHPQSKPSPFQVELFRAMLSMPDDTVMMNCDAVSLRGFISYIVKRHDGSIRRDS